MHRVPSILLCVAALLTSLGITGGQATAKNWNAGNGNWNVPGNWSPTSVPTAGEAVNIFFADGIARTVTYNVSAPSLGLLSIDLIGGAPTAASTLSMPNNNSLSANGIVVGGYSGGGVTSGKGAIIQSAGTATTNPGWDLVMGHGANSTGTYTLSGGALVANHNEYIGLSGTGLFSHSGGTNTINASATGAFILGESAGSTGTYNLSGTGTLTVNAHEYIGSTGTGIFNQTGGSNTISGPGHDLYLAFNPDSTGTYNLSETGALTVNAHEYIGSGFNSTGVFNQTGGSNTISGPGNNLYLGFRGGSTGTYTLSSGTLSVDGFVAVGNNGGTGVINQSGGAIAVAGNFALGGSGSTDFGQGTYHQSGGIVTVGGNLYIGASADTIGAYHQTGGSITVSGDINVGEFSFANGSEGVYTLGGAATLSANVLRIGSSQFDSFSQTGGTNSVNILTINNGTYRLSGGTLRFDLYARATTGTFIFDAGTIQLAGDRSIGPDPASQDLFGDAIQELFGGAPNIKAGKGLTVEGTATLLTSVTIDGGTFTAGSLVNASNLHFQRGTLNITNQAVTIGSGGLLGDTLDLNNDMTINVVLGITNNGLVTGDGRIDGTFSNAAAGELRAQAGRSLRLTGSGNTNAGQIKLFGGELEFTQNLTNSAGAFISGNGTLLTGGLTNHGTMNFAGSANLVGDVTNSATGKIISGGGGATIFYDDVTNQGEIRTSTNGFTVFFGSVSGSGTYTGTGTVNFEGDLKPGNSPAQVNFGGNVALGPEAAILIEIGGNTLGTQYDSINVTGSLTLDGTLAVSLTGGFSPAAGNSYNILDWGSRSGTFSALTLPTLAAGLTWNTSQLYASGVLSVGVGLSGDFDLDGDVDGRDFLAWQRNPSIGNLADWQANYGAGSLVAKNVAVPEPSTLLLLTLATIGGWASRRTDRQVS